MAAVPAFAVPPTDNPGAGHRPSETPPVDRGRDHKPAKGTTDSPRKACKDLSKKHTKGEKGTPFSRCVVEGAQLLKE